MEISPNLNSDSDNIQVDEPVLEANHQWSRQRHAPVKSRVHNSNCVLLVKLAQKNKYVETAINIKTIKSENIGEALANEDVLLLGVIVLPKIRLHQAK